MNLQTLLGDLPKSSFAAEYLYRLPFSRPGGAMEFSSLGTWDSLGEAISHRDADVMVVRDGEQYMGGDPRSIEEAKALSYDGWTILVRNAERRLPGLRQVADAFFAEFRAPVNIHFYVTPPGRHGFSWHYDAEDVFIIQTGGEKEYLLRKNTVHPWPLEETIPADMRYGMEIMPLSRVTLARGDWLYIPCGWWHKAEALDTGETAISLAIGIFSPAAIDVFDFLRRHLISALLWRQRLPVAGAAASLSDAELASKHRRLFSELADDLSKKLRDEEFLQSYLDARRSEIP